MTMRADALKFARTFLLPCLIGAVGGFIFDRAGLPAAWMSGSLVAVSIAALAGLDVRVPTGITSAVFLLLGTVMGSAVTPETLRLALSWPISMGGLLVLVPATVAAIMIYLIRFERFDRPTAFYASIPGAMSYVMALTMSSKADARAVVMVHSLRLVLLVAVLPSFLVLASLGGTAARPAVAAGPATWFDYPLLAVMAVSCGLGMERLKVPGGATVGAMLASAVLHGTGLVTAGLPPALMFAALVVMGVLIAARFSGTALAELRQLVKPATGAFVIATLVTLVVASLVAVAAGLPVGKVILAYAPGGIEAMAILAFVLDMDPAFVGAHHIVRFVGIALVLPLAARLLLGPAE
ncbi:AbrB family transcriptional regulator [Phreatobacter sp. AB_2022a]|uniref:AbrB family transcriptional regulator n=1 Tax=Phreatobacter sp. AB_2022a TaxID=3003134 RepID=UPI0022873457|nr:AbrB family transcriptional regulator [Phreatobacter sp. AB_2022a]MCZ0737545.1 AbrB family transcriptional regulator [Phreatobacter sp. AB_2022a]